MIIHSDCILAMSEMEPSSIDAIVTDPPYGLEFMGKEWDKFGGQVVGEGYAGDGGAKRYFNKRNKPIYTWDMNEYYQFSLSWATEALRVLKPGGSLLSFGGTRTFHRLTCGLEDAGFIIKDCLMFLYGSGFPKSQDLGKMIDKQAGIEVPEGGSIRVAGEYGGRNLQPPRRTEVANGQYQMPAPASDLARHWDGYKIGGIKPAWENILWAVKPWSDCDIIRVLVRNLLSNLEVLQCLINQASTTDLDFMERIIPHGKAGDSSEATDMPCGKSTASSILNTVSLWRNCLVGLSQKVSKFTTSTDGEMITDLRTCDSLLSAATQVCTTQGGISQNGGALSVANAVHTLAAVYTKHRDTLTSFAQENVTGSQLGEALSTSGETPLSPNWLPIIWAVKPPEGSYIDNILEYGVGAVNVDECRIGTDATETRVSGGKGFGANFRDDNWQPPDESYTLVSKGRFPANLLLSHAPGCREVGTKRVKGSDRPGHEGKSSTESMFTGKSQMHSSITHADPDGYETISAWECEPDCPARLLDEQSGVTGGKWGKQGEKQPSSMFFGEHADGIAARSEEFIGDTGGASRFFYTSKATNRDSYNDHPTLKPTDLIEWLIRLVTRPGQTVLDPFAGSGTTGVAAIQSGREFVLIEQDEHYCEICEKRTTDGAQQGMF